MESQTGPKSPKTLSTWLLMEPWRPARLMTPLAVIIALGLALWYGGGGYDTDSASAEDTGVGVLAGMAVAADTRRLALVMHVDKKHMTAQIDSIRRWSDPANGYSVCGAGSENRGEGTQADMLWVIADDVTHESAMLMLSPEEYWTRVMKVALNASAECFGNLVVTFEKPSAMTIETGCQDCSRFFNTLDDLKDRYNYFMELRPELVPTRSHWLDVLMSEIKSAGAFWILGPSACVSEGGVTNARSGHVSPFSVFGLDAGLVKFVAKVRDAFPPFDGCPRGCTTGRFDILGIQSTFRQFLEDPAHPLLYRAAASAKMVRARTIVDLCGSVVRADQVHAALPDAALVHATLAPAGPSSTETAEDLNALTPPPPVPIDEPASAPDADPLTLYLASKDGRPYLPHWPAELHPAPASVYRAILDRFVAVFPEMRCCMDLLTRPGMIEPLYEEEQRANATHPWEREALPMYITHYTPLKARKQYLRNWLKPLGVNPRLVVGWDKQNLSTSDVSCIAPSHDPKGFRLGEISLSVKHTAVFVDMIRRGIPQALILEDDAGEDPEIAKLEGNPGGKGVMPSLSEVFQSMVDAVRLAPSNYSAVFTGTCLGMRAGGGMDSLVDAQKRLNFTVTRPVVVASGLSRCTHGYVLSAWGALRMATSLPLDGPIDHSFNHGGPKSGRRGDAVSIYHMEPAVLIQKGDLPHSDIRVDERRRRRRLAEHAAAVDWR